MIVTDKQVIQKLVEALEQAQEHLDYCNWGDKWEREVAEGQKLPDKIQDAVEAGNTWLETH